MQETWVIKKALHINVHGRVQGVGFRYFVQHLGVRLGLTGNVHNCADGTVEIIVEGVPKQLDEFVDLVKKGPRMAWIEHVDIHEVPLTDNFSSFQIEGW
jgi:acylphosphatase